MAVSCSLLTWSLEPPSVLQRVCSLFSSTSPSTFYQGSSFCLNQTHNAASFSFSEDGIHFFPFSLWVFDTMYFTSRKTFSNCVSLSCVLSMLSLARLRPQNLNPPKKDYAFPDTPVRQTLQALTNQFSPRMMKKAETL